MGEATDSDMTWINEQEKLMEDGEQMVRRASDEALDYLQDAVENLGDAQWRRMVIASQATEMGVGGAIADHVVPKVYNDIPKRLSKKLKIPREVAEALAHIYIGRVIRNVRKELNGNTKL